MSTAAAPAFENKSTCSKCNTSFNLFTRKHHCRQCGRTFCDRCSSWNIPLPHFGFSEPVRVDEKCYQSIQQKQASQPKAPSSSSSSSSKPINTETSAKTSSSISTDTSAPTCTPTPTPSLALARVRPCTCNMPLCICPPDEPSADEKQNASSQSLKHDKDKPAVSRPAAAIKTPTTTSSFSGFGGFPSSRSSAATGSITYDLHGDLNEQCRDAIKQGDAKGTETLLKAGAKPNYIDRTGNTLLHLACMFDRWDTVSLFLSAGGDVTIRNPAGETPLDLAPPALQHKIKQRLQN